MTGDLHVKSARIFFFDGQHCIGAGEQQCKLWDLFVDPKKTNTVLLRNPSYRAAY